MLFLKVAQTIFILLRRVNLEGANEEPVEAGEGD